MSLEVIGQVETTRPESAVLHIRFRPGDISRIRAAADRRGAATVSEFVRDILMAHPEVAPPACPECTNRTWVRYHSGGWFCPICLTRATDAIIARLDAEALL